MLDFIYPLPDRKEPTVTDKLDLLESFNRYIKSNAENISELERLIANPNDIQNLFRKESENRQELSDALALRERLKRMWNRTLNDLVIR